MTDNNLEWLKANVSIFLDENIHASVRSILRSKGYLKVENVFTLGYKGSNDGKLLTLIKTNNMLLVTHDKHFHKQSVKYHDNFSLLILPTQAGTIYGSNSIAKQIQAWLIKNYTVIRSRLEILEVLR